MVLSTTNQSSGVISISLPVLHPEKATKRSNFLKINKQRIQIFFLVGDLLNISTTFKKIHLGI